MKQHGACKTICCQISTEVSLLPQVIIREVEGLQMEMAIHSSTIACFLLSPFYIQCNVNFSIFFLLIILREEKGASK